MDSDLMGDPTVQKTAGKKRRRRPSKDRLRRKGAA
jgi:hypothetical protein